MGIIMVFWNCLLTFKTLWQLYRVIEKDGRDLKNRYNLKSTGRIYTFSVLKCSEKFKVLDLTWYICKLITVKLNLI